MPSAWAGDGGRPRLGLSVSAMQTSSVLRQHLRLGENEGILVSNVVVGGELEAAGVTQGDILLSVDGHTMGKPSDLTAYISGLPQGTKVKLDVIQSGEHRQVYVTLDNLPDEIVWKYMQSVASPGRSKLGAGNTPQKIQPNPSMPLMPPSQGFQPLVRGHNQVSTYSSVIATPQGVQTSTVTIRGDREDPDSTVEVAIGNDRWETTIGEIDKLPDQARDAAHSALSQRGIGSFGMDGDDLFEELLRRHYEHMNMMDEVFRHQFAPQVTPGQINGGIPDEPMPVMPGPGDIRS